jgi:hypothetical protein
MEFPGLSSTPTHIRLETHPRFTPSIHGSEYLIHTQNSPLEHHIDPIGIFDKQLGFATRDSCFDEDQTSNMYYDPCGVQKEKTSSKKRVPCEDVYFGQQDVFGHSQAENQLVIKHDRNFQKNQTNVSEFLEGSLASGRKLSEIVNPKENHNFFSNAPSVMNELNKDHKEEVLLLRVLNNNQSDKTLTANKKLSSKKTSCFRESIRKENERYSYLLQGSNKKPRADSSFHLCEKKAVLFSDHPSKLQYDRQNNFSLEKKSSLAKKSSIKLVNEQNEKKKSVHQCLCKQIMTKIDQARNSQTTEVLSVILERVNSLSNSLSMIESQHIFRKNQNCSIRPALQTIDEVPELPIMANPKKKSFTVKENFSSTFGSRNMSKYAPIRPYVLPRSQRRVLADDLLNRLRISPSSLHLTKKASK